MGIAKGSLSLSVNDGVLEEFKKQRILESYAEFLKGHGWKYFITLNFRREVKEARAQEISARFVKSLNVKIFGARSRKAVRLVVSIEKNFSGGYHLHALAEDPSPRIKSKEKREIFDFREVIKECWQNADASTALVSLSSPDNNSWFQVVESEDRVIRYILKEMRQGRFDCLQINVINLNGRRNVPL